MHSLYLNTLVSPLFFVLLLPLLFGIVSSRDSYQSRVQAFWFDTGFEDYKNHSGITMEQYKQQREYLQLTVQGQPVFQLNQFLRKNNGIPITDDFVEADFAAHQLVMQQQGYMNELDSLNAEYTEDMQTCSR